MYQDLIVLGPEAPLFLFHDLEQPGDDNMSKALTILTGDHLVPAEDRSKIRKVAEAWLAC